MSIHDPSSVAHHFIMRVRSRRSLSVSFLVLAAALSGLALRLVPGAAVPGIYRRFRHVRGTGAQLAGRPRLRIDYANRLVPSDVRVPGYPAFLALVYLVIGRGERAIVLAQAIVDLGACFLIAWLAALLAPAPHRRRVALVALWLAATCPFVANYAAAPLPEVLATLLTTATLLALIWGLGSLTAASEEREARIEWRPWLGRVYWPGWAHWCDRRLRWS